MQTPKQSKHVTTQSIKLYNCIVAFKVQFGHPPSLREMCTLMSVNSTSHVRGYVCVLEKWHWIELDGGQCRRMRLTRPTEIEVPLAIRSAASIKGDQLDKQWEQPHVGQRLMVEVNKP